MLTKQLAAKLVAARTDRARRKLLEGREPAADIRLAREIKDICYAAWTLKPARAREAAAALAAVAQVNSNLEIAALASLVDGIALITKGELGSAVNKLTDAARRFDRAGLGHDAALTAVPKLVALALLGRYSQAIAAGKKALAGFEAGGDDLAAGKIELNLSNIYSRREQHRESEKLCLSALRRFRGLGERHWAAMAENDLAITYTNLNEFRKAETFFEAALETARSENLLVTQAEIEASLGNMAMMRGNYSAALRSFEISRGIYAALKMPHQTATAELELAGIYAELNLNREAAVIFRRSVRVLRRLGLTREEARGRIGLGRIAAAERRRATARRELERAVELFRLERNPTGQAGARLDLGLAELGAGRPELALSITANADVLSASEDPRHPVNAKWIEAEALRLTGRTDEAEQKLQAVERAAQGLEHFPAALAALNSLGKIAFANGSKRKAEGYFRRAITVADRLRSAIHSDEFRTALMAVQLEPFEQLASLLLADRRIEDAFEVTEWSRSRSLADTVGGRSVRSGPLPEDVATRAADLREKLNWEYRRLETGKVKGKRTVRRLERELAELLRRLDSIASADGCTGADRKPLLHRLQGRLLGRDWALIEYVENNGVIGAFVVTNVSIEFVDHLCIRSEIEKLLDGFYFQINSQRMRPASPNTLLTQRANRYLNKLYELLLAPLMPIVREHSVVIVPAGPLHRVPFHALNDGSHYLIEAREVAYSPSAAIYTDLAARSHRKARSALVLSFADDKIPLVDTEAAVVADKLRNVRSFSGEAATFDAYRRHASTVDVIHFACHGEFRADNPLYSSLHLADGWVTVNDVARQRLRARLVTLSACETGAGEVRAGGEVLGLARGFLAAGVSSLVLSLWNVNDASTSDLMSEFYSQLRSGKPVSASLRAAQMKLIADGLHPYYWSPFILVGV